MTIEIHPLTGSIGAALTGVKLTDLDEHDFAVIHRAMLDHCVLVFSEQFLDIDQHEAFAAWWGEVGVTPFVEYIDGHPGVLALTNLGKERSVTENWHYDSTFLRAPHAYTILSAKVIPVGGDTMWSNQYLAYEALSPGYQRLLGGVRAKFCGTRLARRIGNAGQPPYSFHPVFRTHPETGRIVLYIGHPGDTVTELEGLTEAESRPIIDYLYEHSQSPDRVYRHRWSEGDVVMWDNRCTMHYAVHDYGEQQRLIHRISIKGDEPRADLAAVASLRLTSSLTIAGMMNRDWLGLRTERAIEPDLEIVDPHHHMWNYESAYGRYEVDDLRIDTGSGHNVVETVFIDCGANYLTEGPEHLRPVGETIYVAGRADETDRTPGAVIAAIVSRADLTLGGAVREVLEAHVESAGGRFRGIRHSGASTDDPSIPSARAQPPLDLYSQPSFAEGARVLADMALSFEAWQYHYQLDEALALARAVPDLSIIVNHLGGPMGVGRYAERHEEVMAETRAGLARLAECDNVVLKVGGVGMTRFGGGWDTNELPPSSDDVVARWGDMLDWCIQTFEPSRCMFESNYPVDGETCSYAVLWNVFKKASSSYSDDERADLFAGTARRIYRL